MNDMGTYRRHSVRLAAGLLLAGLALTCAPAARAAGSVACNGQQDATAALNSAAASGGEVRIGPGTCLMSGPLILPSNTTLVGAGAGTTVLRAVAGDAINVIEVGSPPPGPGSVNVDISGVSVDGSATQGDTIGHHSDGILVRSASGQVRIHNVEVYNAGDNGIDVIGSHVDVTDSSVHDNFHNGIYVKGIGRPGGAHIVRASYVRVLRNRVSHNSRGKPPGSARKFKGPAWDGIDIDPVTANCLVEGNVVDGNDIILLEHGKVAEFSGPHRVIDNVVMNSNQAGIDVAGNIDGFEVIGNRIENVSVFGIIVGGEARHGVIRGNTIRNTTGEGIMVRTRPGAVESQDIEISGNTVSPGPGSGGAAAIAVRHTPGVRVMGNRVDPGSPIDLRSAGPGLVEQDNH